MASYQVLRLGSCKMAVALPLRVLSCTRDHCVSGSRMRLPSSAPVPRVSRISGVTVKALDTRAESSGGPARDEENTTRRLEELAVGCRPLISSGGDMLRLRLERRTRTLTMSDALEVNVL